MSLFCFLWTPLFYLFRRSLGGDSGGGSGRVWALILGSVVALVQFFFGALIDPGGFAFSRWVSACIDIVALPAVLPLMVYFLLAALRTFSGPADFTGFALLWLIPGAAIRAVSWSAQNDPILLVLAPLLWTAIAVGVPLFIEGVMARGSLVSAILGGLGILALPLLAATAWWAFFSQRLILGFLFFLVTLVPLGLSLGAAFLRGGD